MRIRPISAPAGSMSSATHSLSRLTSVSTGSPAAVVTASARVSDTIRVMVCSRGRLCGLGCYSQQPSFSVENLIARPAGYQLPRLPDPKFPEVEGVAHTERVYGSKSLIGVSSSTISGSGPARSSGAAGE